MTTAAADGRARAAARGGHLRLGRHADAVARRRPAAAVAGLRPRGARPAGRGPGDARRRPRRGRLAGRCASTQAEERAWSRGRETHESASIEAILADAGVDAAHDRHLLALAAYRRFWEPHTHTDPQVRPLWEGLHDRGLKVGVLSNTIWSRDYHREVFQRDGVLDLVDGDVYSSEIHVVKPHAEAFLRGLRGGRGRARVRRSTSATGSFEDVHGPQQVGMRAIWVPHSDIPGHQQVAVDVDPGRAGPRAARHPRDRRRLARGRSVPDLDLTTLLLMALAGFGAGWIDAVVGRWRDWSSCPRCCSASRGRPRPSCWRPTRSPRSSARRPAR